MKIEALCRRITGNFEWKNARNCEHITSALTYKHNYIIAEVS